MNDAPKSLDALRREIDAVDDALHDLLQRRAALVADIGALKSSQNTAVFRPAREAKLLRRLLARNGGGLPAQAVARIWAEIIATSTQIQGGLTVSCCPIGDIVTGDRLARERFGVGVKVVPAPSPAQVVTAVTSGEASVGVVPVPRQDDAAPWWPMLCDASRGTAIQVVAAVPFVLGEGAAEASALVVAPDEGEPSGDDRSLLVFECGEPLSRDRLRGELQANGLDAAAVVSFDDAARRGIHLLLADIAGHVALDDARLKKAQLALPADQVWPLGVYAAPVRIGA